MRKVSMSEVFMNDVFIYKLQIDVDILQGAYTPVTLQVV